MIGVLLDLDQTLIDSSALEAVRKSRDWQRVYTELHALSI